MKYTEFYDRFKGMYTKVRFTNEHGEDFILIKTKPMPMYFITGAEFDWDVERLFNKSFDIWSDEEIKLLGKALGEI